MKKNNGKKKFMNRIIAVIGICAAIVIVYFAVVNIPQKEKTVTVTDASKMLLENFDDNYPQTPKEVVKAYAEISKCYYESDTTEDQISELAKMMRKLLDDELIANQTFDAYLDSLKSDILTYRDKARTISSYAVSASTDVKYSDTDQGSLAALYCTFNLRQDGKISPVKQQFILRKDTEGHWKILGYRSASEASTESATE